MKGLLFKPDMIKAIIEGRKTVTRRLSGLKEINQNPDKWHIFKCNDGYWGFTDANWKQDEVPEILLKSHGKKPHYLPGETVYIKEAHYAYGYWFIESDEVRFRRNPNQPIYFSNTLPKDYEILTGRSKVGWYLRSPMLMPAKIARHFLEILDVRPERLLDITDEDCFKEGIKRAESYSLSPSSYIPEYMSLWDSINGKDSHKLNPWVWRIEFKLKEAGG